MSDMFELLAMMAAVATFFGTVRYLNLRPDRSAARRPQRITDRRERTVAVARR